MKIHALLVVGFALFVTACAEKEQAPPAMADAAGIAAQPTERKAGMGSKAFIRHMHHHASHVEGHNAALAVGDLEAAQATAYWLLRHEQVTDLPDDWQPHIETMRTAARAVADAANFQAASAAARQITEGCRGCHVAAGADIDLSGLMPD